MARIGRQFALYRLNRGRGQYVVDVQANALSGLRFRVVVPLLPASETPPGLPWLNPKVSIDGNWFIFTPNAVATLPISELGPPIADLSDHQDDFNIAFDLLLRGLP